MALIDDLASIILNSKKGFQLTVAADLTDADSVLFYNPTSQRVERILKQDLVNAISLYLGYYPSLAALQAAYPVANEGNFADVDAGAGNPTDRYIWDADGAEFVKIGSSIIALPAGGDYGDILKKNSNVDGDAIWSFSDTYIATYPKQKTYADITALLADQGAQTENFIQYVTDASLDPDVSSGFAAYRKLSTNLAAITDYKRLSDEELRVQLRSYAHQNFTVGAIATNSISSVADGSIGFEYENVNNKITGIFVDKLAANKLSSVSALVDTLGFSALLYNRTKEKYSYAIIDGATAVTDYLLLEVKNTIDFTDFEVNDVVELIVTLGAGSGGGASLSKEYSQTAHGFTGGEWLRHDGVDWVEGTADTGENSNVLGVVSEILDADNFVLQFGGTINLPSLSVGQDYYLQNAGGIGVTAGTVNKYVGTETPDGFLIDIAIGFVAAPTMPPSGASGTTGFLGADYRFDDSISATQPSDGRFRFNNANIASATELYLSGITRDGDDANFIISQIKVGDKIYIQNTEDANERLGLLIDSITDNTGWFTVGFTIESQGGDLDWSTGLFTRYRISFIVLSESSEDLFLGQYVNLTALETAHPSPAVGSYGYVDAGVGSDVEVYVWDDDDAQYVKQLGESTAETPASIKSKYESNANTNEFNDAEKAKLANQSGTNTGDQDEEAVEGNIITDAAVTGTKDIDWAAGSMFRFTMTGDTVFSDINLPAQGFSRPIQIELTGERDATLPTGWTPSPKNDTYDGAKNNLITATINRNDGTLVIYYALENMS